LDNMHKKPRRGRSAAINMVITSTGAGKAVTKVVPSLKDKLTANAVRVPTPNGSLAILNLNINKETSVDEINEIIKNVSLSSANAAQQITDIQAQMEGITRASEEQSEGIIQINKAIGQIEQSTQENAEASQNSSERAQEMQRGSTNIQSLADSLTELIEGRIKTHQVSLDNKVNSIQSTELLHAMPNMPDLTIRAIGQQQSLPPNSDFSEFQN
ncbi:hypothetical protein MJH12_05240, partial [bacterium]|nr:hypothetical protein [bacterium]